MADDVRRATGVVENAVIDRLGLRDAVDGAKHEAQNSGLPGLYNGPADAYRHLIISGEIVRRYGPIFGPPLAGMHETLNQIAGQPRAESDMDRHNNQLAINGPDHETWEDVVIWARGKIIEAAAHDADGKEGRPTWYNKQPPGWRPDFRGVPVTAIEKGGPEHAYEPAEGLFTEPMGTAEAEPGMPPLERPVVTWSEGDVRQVINSSAYLGAQHPDHRRVQRDAREWFERRFGNDPVPLDATGRRIRELPSPSNLLASSPPGAGCDVPVRAHSREGGKVQVDAYCRSKPAA